MDIARQRLSRTFLVRPDWSTGRDVVRALGAVQAQDYDGAKWALSMRTSGATDDALEREFASGTILRTHVLRPTWHFVHPADIRWLLALTAPHVMRTMASYDLKLELDDKIFRRTNAAIAKALRDNNHLTRTELKAVLTRARIGSLGVQRTAHIMMRAELEGIVCSGPRRGKQFTYALLDERAPAVAAKDRDEALRDLTQLYFRTRSPATAQDYGWWSGLPMTDVRRGIELAGSVLEKVMIDDKAYWSTGAPPAAPAPGAWLLPNYDEFFIAYRDRSAIGKRLSNVKAVTGGNFLIAHVVAMDGQLVGGWRRVLRGDEVTLHFDLRSRLSASERARLRAAIARYEAFAGRKVKIQGLAAGRRAPVR